MTNLHIALACAIGAGLGFHISWKVAPAFWWIGVLIGGAGAFLIAAAPQLLGAIRHGWQRIIDDLPLGAVSLRYSVYGMVRAIILTMYLMAFVNMAMWLFSPEVLSRAPFSYYSVGSRLVLAFGAGKLLGGILACLCCFLSAQP